MGFVTAVDNLIYISAFLFLLVSCCYLFQIDFIYNFVTVNNNDLPFTKIDLVMLLLNNYNTTVYMYI